MAQSNSYNPFHYLNKEHEEDVMTLIDSIMKNTDGDKNLMIHFGKRVNNFFYNVYFFICCMN